MNESDPRNPKKFTEGMLLLKQQEVPLPVKKTQVWASVIGLLTQVRVVQTFQNPYDKPIEAIYVFPLPHKSAVHEMKMVVGDRVITGEVREREEARKLYEDARDEGRATSLLEQERPNIFTVNVANIMPGEEVLMDIRYHEKLEYRDGEYRFVFPMVVSPRYCPGDSTETKQTRDLASSTAVVDADRITPPLLPPQLRSGHNIELELTLETGLAISKMDCLSHEVDIVKDTENRAVICLHKKDEIPNRDFVFIYKTACDKTGTSFFTYRRREENGYFLLMLNPPEYSDKVVSIPKEMIFVIDRSGSMSGDSIVQARRALKASLRSLNRDDTFAIIPFNDRVEYFSPTAVPFTQDKLEEADKYIDTIEAGGGTEIKPVMSFALQIPRDDKRIRMVVFMTDGTVGNEEEVLQCIQRFRGDARIYNFGIGSAVNRYLLDKMAEVGRGFVEYLLPEQDIEETIRRFQDKISLPILTDISLRWENVQVVDVYPPQMPDLFVGEPVVVVGRFLTSGSGRLVIEGKEATKGLVLDMALDMPQIRENYPAIPILWARERIGHLCNREREDKSAKTKYRDEILSLAIQYHLTSTYTSFVAVEKLAKRDGKGQVQERCTAVYMPTELPHGMDYNTLTGQIGAASPIVNLGSVGYSGGVSYCLKAPSMPDPRASSIVSPPRGTCAGSYSGSPGSTLNRPVFKKFAQFQKCEQRKSDITPAPIALAPDTSRAVVIPDNIVEMNLKYLTRVQNADGSWGKGTEATMLTSLCILAFANAGHTDKKGNYTTYLRRAISYWKDMPATSNEEILSYCLATLVLIKEGSGLIASLSQYFCQKLQTVEPHSCLDMVLKHRCLVERERLGNPHVEYSFSLMPPSDQPDTSSPLSLFETICVSCHQKDKTQIERLKRAIFSAMTQAGDDEGRVHISCGDIAGTIGCALLFGWKI